MIPELFGFPVIVIRENYRRSTKQQIPQPSRICDTGKMEKLSAKQIKGSHDPNKHIAA